jgi:hypothetical protein
MIAVLCALVFAPPGPELAVSTHVVVKVTDRVKAADTLAAQAEKLGGYFTARNDSAVSLKVPAGEGDALTAFAQGLGIVIQTLRTATDAGSQLSLLRAQLQSKSDVLQRYYGVIAEASASEVVAVEREMTRLVQEIEAVKGQLRLLEHQVAFASVTVTFQFVDRRPPVPDGSSSFAWLNTVNLTSLLSRFSHED